MSQLKFSTDHDWVRIDDNGEAVVGITDFAQGELGDVVYVELPEVGRKVSAGEEAVVVESVKAASDVKMPISGTIIAVNESLQASPELINQGPLGDGWIIRLQPSHPDELDQLMDENAYQDFVEAEN